MDSTPESTATPEAQRSPGVILAAERERQGLARADVAQRLHMSVSQIEALEAGDYGRLPRGTFLRGFTRNYARALGLDAEALVGLLSQDAPRENAPGIVVPSQNIRFDPLGQRLASPYVKAAGIAAAALVFGFAAMYWWLFIRPQPVSTTVPAKAPAVAAPAPSAEPAEPPKAEPAKAEQSAAHPRPALSHRPGSPPPPPPPPHPPPPPPPAPPPPPPPPPRRRPAKATSSSPSAAPRGSRSPTPRARCCSRAPTRAAPPRRSRASPRSPS